MKVRIVATIWHRRQIKLAALEHTGPSQRTNVTLKSAWPVLLNAISDIKDFMALALREECERGSFDRALEKFVLIELQPDSWEDHGRRKTDNRASEV